MTYSAAPEHLEQCLHGQAAPCTCGCWFDLDVRELITKLKRGNFGAAFSLYRNAVVFPGIVSALCDAPCGERCVLFRKGEQIQLRLLERAAVEFGRQEPIALNLAGKQKTVVVIGGGGSGLACALRLASKGYSVQLCEREPYIGGILRKYLPQDILQEELEREFRYAPYSLVLNCEISSLDQVSADAIYIATGAGGDKFGLDFTSNVEGVFLGGMLAGVTSPIAAIAQGIHAAQEIEAYLISGHTAAPATLGKKALSVLDPASPLPQSAFTRVLPEADRAFTRAEARAEAERCLRCDCTRCYDHCDLMQYYKKYPRKLVQETDATFHPDVFSPANHSRMICSCTMCGGCGESCPMGIDMEQFFLASRRELQQNRRVPPVFHEFWLRDMDHANSEYCRFLSKGKSNSPYAFFPGCQLGASDPTYVLETLKLLRSSGIGMGVLIQCCGAPALWSGQEDAIQEATDSLTAAWKTLGKPTLVVACPSCQKYLPTFLPEANVISIYSYLHEKNVPLPSTGNGAERYYLFDSCTADITLRVQVRELLQVLGVVYDTSDLNEVGSCCGYGGGIGIANPEMFRKIVDTRVSKSALPYLTYCVNCRDIFTEKGKPSVHILELLTGQNRQPLSRPSITQRRKNRELLFQALSQKLNFVPEARQGEEARHGAEWVLKIPDELRQRLDREHILEDDICTVIRNCEETQRLLVRKVDNTRIGHWRVGNVTYWAEYQKEGSCYMLEHFYSHRMQIEDDNHA